MAVDLLAPNAFPHPHPRPLPQRERGVERASVHEVFVSRQGEGLWAGERQVFVRFSRCNLHCGYCDEPDALTVSERDWVTGAVLSERVRHAATVGGALTDDQLGTFAQRVDEAPFGAFLGPAWRAGCVERLRDPAVRRISLTGGEPLLQASFLRRWLPTLRPLGLRGYLETNGTLPEALEAVLGEIEVVAMDLKPPTSTGDRPWWNAHARFLEVARSRTVFVKVVVTAGTATEEIARAIDLVAAQDRTIPFILQPVTPCGTETEPPSPAQVRGFQELAGRRLRAVHVMPQLHKLWGVP